MSSHKIFHLKRDGNEESVALKINHKDHYVRIASPFHEVIHLRHQLFHASQVVVSNAYGAPIFNLLAPARVKDQWIIQHQGVAPFKVSFSHNGHTNATLEDDTYGTLRFSILEHDEPNEREKEMIGAALAACHLHHQFASERVAEIA